MPAIEGLHVPPATVRLVEKQVADYKAAHNGFFPPTHDYAGMNPERQSIGLPGHCDICATIGHVDAHPDYGCGDVGCNRDH